MRQLNAVFIQAMNNKHYRIGHLFQGRYKAILVDKKYTYLWELCRYIVLNPLRASMVDSLDDWPIHHWQIAPPSWLATAINAYIKFVYQGVQKRIWDDLKHQIYLGNEDFVKQHQALQQMSDGDLSEVPLKQRRPPPAMRQSLTHTVLEAIPKNRLVDFLVFITHW
ncbi:transposase [Aeromonas caviae]